MPRINRQALVSLLFLGTLAAVALVIGFLQYHWLGEVSAAERERLRSSLQGGLVRVAEEFDSRILTAASAVAPGLACPSMSVPVQLWRTKCVRSDYALTDYETTFVRTSVQGELE